MYRPTSRTLSMTTIHQSIKEVLRSVQDGILLEDGASLSFNRSRILRFAHAMGKALQAQDTRREDRIADVLPEGARLRIAFLGASIQRFKTPSMPESADMRLNGGDTSRVSAGHEQS